jgi:hypothetical protein
MDSPGLRPAIASVTSGSSTRVFSLIDPGGECNFGGKSTPRGQSRSAPQSLRVAANRNHFPATSSAFRMARSRLPPSTLMICSFV